MKRKIKWVCWSVLFLAMFVSGCVAPGDADITPLLWRATNGSGQTVYLFGSVRAVHYSAYPLPEFIMDAFERSDYLAVEIPLPILLYFADEWEAARSKLVYQDGRTIVDDIGSELYERAVAVFTEMGILGFIVHCFEIDYKIPLFWWMEMTAMAMRFMFNEAGFAYWNNVAEYFEFRAETREREMGIFEILPIERQIEILTELPIEFYIYSLEAIINMVEDGSFGLFIRENATLFREAYEAWKIDDERFDGTSGIEGNMIKAFEEEWRETVTAQRDSERERRIGYIIEEGKNAFVVVGMEHIVGEGGIVDFLVRKGYTVEIIR